MTIVIRLLTLIIISFYLSGSVFYAKKLEASSSNIMQTNPFSSLLPQSGNSTIFTKLLSKSALEIKKIPSGKKLEILKKTAEVKVESLKLKKKSSVETDISSRAKQLTKILNLKDILETSEGRYAFIDENKVSYIVQEGGWLDTVFVRHIYKNSVELQEIDGNTTIILVLTP